MALIMVLVIPNLAQMLNDAGQEIPLYTRIVIGTSLFISHYFIFISALMLAAIVFLGYYVRTPAGKDVLSRAKLETPAVGGIFKKIYP